MSELDTPRLYRITISDPREGKRQEVVLAVSLVDAMETALLIHNDSYSRDDPCGLDSVTFVESITSQSDEILLSKQTRQWIYDFYGTDDLLKDD